jgi:hypothetical protein
VGGGDKGLGSIRAIREDQPPGPHERTACAFAPRHNCGGRMSVFCYLSSPLTARCHSSFGFARLPVSTRSERQLSPQPRLNSAHPTSESADPRSRRGKPERGQSRPKSQASAYLPTTRRSEPCTPPRRPAHHRAEPQTTNKTHAAPVSSRRCAAL